MSLIDTVKYNDMDQLHPEQFNALARRRRSIFPNMYNERPISRAIIEQILENANWAPTHQKTEPWRFRVFLGDSRERLSEYLSSWYSANTPADRFSEIKMEKMRQNPLRSACVIAICMARDPKERVPEWEELAAVACAVQNMWLSCAAYGIGSYWSTPPAILEAGEFLDLGPGERCLGLFYMGYHDMPEIPGQRGPISEKTIWLGE
jgi:nitroreductase